MVFGPNKQPYLTDDIVVEQFGQFSYKFKLDKLIRYGTYNITFSILDSRKHMSINVRPNYDESLHISETLN